MARMTLAYSDLYTKVSNFLGLTTTGTAPTGTDLTTCKDLVHRGIRQFCYPIDAKSGLPHVWSFLNQYHSFDTAADQWKYALPIDFSDLNTDITFDEDEALPPLRKRSGQQIKKMRSLTDSTGWPMFYAIVALPYDIEIGTKYELWLYPTPSTAKSLSCFYRPDVVQLSATTDLAVGGIMATEAILESCLAVAELQEDENSSTTHQQKAAELIQTAIEFDKGKTDTDVIGNLHSSRFRNVDASILIPQDVNETRDIYSADR